MDKWQSAVKDGKLTMIEMDQLATEMKCVWHDAGLWDYGTTPHYEEGLLEP